MDGIANISQFAQLQATANAAMSDSWYNVEIRELNNASISEHQPV